MSEWKTTYTTVPAQPGWSVLWTFTDEDEKVWDYGHTPVVAWRLETSEHTDPRLGVCSTLIPITICADFVQGGLDEIVEEPSGQVWRTGGGRWLTRKAWLLSEEERYREQGVARASGSD